MFTDEEVTAMVLDLWLADHVPGGTIDAHDAQGFTYSWKGRSHVKTWGEIKAKYHGRAVGRLSRRRREAV